MSEVSGQPARRSPKGEGGRSEVSLPAGARRAKEGGQRSEVGRQVEGIGAAKGRCGGGAEPSELSLREHAASLGDLDDGVHNLTERLP